MCGWAGWNAIPTADPSIILSRMHILVDHINDDTIELVVAYIPSLVCDPATRKGYDISAPNRQCCWMSNPGYCTEYLRIEAKKAAAETVRLAAAALKVNKKQKVADSLAEKRRRGDDIIAGGGSL